MSSLSLGWGSLETFEPPSSRTPFKLSQSKSYWQLNQGSSTQTSHRKSAIPCTADCDNPNPADQPTQTAIHRIPRDQFPGAADYE